MNGGNDENMLTETRTERAWAIASTPDTIKLIKEGVFKVQSQSGARSYHVERTDRWRCDCPDFTTHGVECKHIIAVQLYLEAQRLSLEIVLGDRVRMTYGQDWSAYNLAQTEEIRLFDLLLSELFDSIEEPEQVMGRPRLPLKEQLFCAIQKVYSQLSSRRAEGLYHHALERGQIDHAPHFNTPSKLFNRADVTQLLQYLVAISAQPVAGIEVDFAVDSTGFRTTSFNLYDEAKHGSKKERHWLKAHLCCGVRTNIVTSVIITKEYGADSPQFVPLVRQTANGFEIREVSADLAYSSRSNIEAIRSMGGIPYIPFKSNATDKGHGSGAWKKMYHYFQLNREEFMEHYHKRSNIESTNAAIKRKFGETLKSKNQTAQVNELLAKIVAYNITVLIHEMHENGVEPDFLGLK